MIEKETVIKFAYYVIILLFFIMAVVSNAYYQYSNLQLFNLFSMVVMIFIELKKKKIDRKLFTLLSSLAIMVIITPASIEFFVPLIDINSIQDLKRLVFSAMIFYPFLVAHIIYYLILNWRLKSDGEVIDKSL
ncbi:MAG: hypothetical protein ACJAUV_000508 [Flavobacteriales bacterium]|jgi:hypothetical protein